MIRQAIDQPRVVEDADPYGAVAVTRGKRSSRVRAGVEPRPAYVHRPPHGGA